MRNLLRRDFEDEHTNSNSKFKTIEMPKEIKREEKYIFAGANTGLAMPRINN